MVDTASNVMKIYTQ